MDASLSAWGRGSREGALAIPDGIEVPKWWFCNYH